MAVRVVLVVTPFNLGHSWGGKSSMKEGILPSLGVGYLAAALRKRGHDVVLIDSPALGYDVNDAARAVLREQPTIVGISCITARAGAAYDLARVLRREKPDLILAMGGPHVTAFHTRIPEQCPEIDALFPGEAEWTFADYVDDIDAGRNPAGLPGVDCRTPQGEWIFGPPHEPVKRLDELPIMAWDLYNPNLYRPLPSQGRYHPVATMLTSRGCPWSRCRFCYHRSCYGHPYRRRSPENCVDEIRWLVRDLGYREIIFFDDNFCIHEKWIERFCDLIDREKLRFAWTVEGHVRTVTRTMLRRMAASGCYNIFYGIESGNQELLDLIDKGYTVDKVREAVAWAKEAGMEIRGSFILGLPTETPEMSRKTIRFACELDIDFAQFIPFHVWPGVELESFALAHGKKVPWNDTFVQPSYVPNTYPDAETLAAMVREAYISFYFRPSYLVKSSLKLRHPWYFRRVISGGRYAIRMWARGLLSRRNSALCENHDRISTNNKVSCEPGHVTLNRQDSNPL